MPNLIHNLTDLSVSFSNIIWLNIDASAIKLHLSCTNTSIDIMTMAFARGPSFYIRNKYRKYATSGCAIKPSHPHLMHQPSTYTSTLHMVWTHPSTIYTDPWWIVSRKLPKTHHHQSRAKTHEITTTGFPIDIWKQGSFQNYDLNNNFINMDKERKMPTRGSHFINFRVICAHFQTCAPTETMTNKGSLSNGKITFFVQ